MTYTFDPNRFELIEFYSYPCCVVDRSEEYVEKFDTFRGDKSVKDFFEAALKHAESIVGRSLMDNKIAIKVYDKVENTIFFVGYKDNIWCVGSMLNPYMNSCYKLDLKTLVKTPYPTC